MTDAMEASATIDLHVENIGGISRTEVSFSPGVTILAGENATNRTSLLQAIMAALGSTDVSLKADADAGSVELTAGSETYTRTLERSNGSVTFSGDPYLDDPELADLFAFLLERNDARRTVATESGDLRSVIMQPVDTAAIEADIQQAEARKRKLDDRIEELADLESRLPDLRAEESELTDEIESTQESYESSNAEIEAAEADLQETKAVKETLEGKLEAAQDKRSTLETVTSRLETERESIQALESERDSLEESMADLPESVEAERAEIESELGDLRSRKSRLEAELSELQNLLQFNEDLLQGEVELFGEAQSSSGENVTAQLVEAETVTCWTCGSDVERSQIDATIDRLRELRQDKLARRNDLESEIESLKERQRTLEDRRSERRRLETKLEDVEREIEDRQAAVEDLEGRRETLEAEIETLEAEIDELELGEGHGELLDLHQRANRLELELQRLRSEREDVRAEIESVEETLDEREALTEKRDAVADTLTDLRTRIERLEESAIEEFNSRIEEVLEIMGYENIERIWIERKAGEGSSGPGAASQESTFELHVVRTDASGAAYEDTVAHLSESEREVTGLIFALAGYLVHEVYETVPFMLLDSVEALDSSRIADLVAYFSKEAEYLVIALLEGDAQALDDSYERVREI